MSFLSGHQNLRSVLLDLMFAGIETTSTALTWSTLFMIKYPHIQKKVQEEIQNHVGNSRMVNMDDKINLPYTEAVVQEVLRYPSHIFCGDHVFRGHPESFSRQFSAATEGHKIKHLSYSINTQ